MFPNMKSLINKLISLNTNRQDPFVVSIFGQTASGKTTFIKNLFGLSFPINRLTIIVLHLLLKYIIHWKNA